MMRALVLLTIGLMATGRPPSQLGYAWSYEELAAKSDVVAIVAFVSARDTGVKTALDELRPPLPVLEVNTAFRVLSTLKRDADSKYSFTSGRVSPRDSVFSLKGPS